MAGLDSTGFTLKRLPEIITDLKAKAQVAFGDGITTDEDSVIGQALSTISDELATLWEGLQAVYDSQKPDAAEGNQLNDVADLNGVTRLAATGSTVTATLTGTPATVVPINTLLSVDPTDDQFTLLAPVTLDPTNPVGVLATASGNDATYTITINGTPFAHVASSETAIVIVAALKVLVDAGSEPVTFTDNLDGTFRIDADDQTLPFTLGVSAEITIDESTNTGSFESVETGPIAAPLSTLTQIDTPVFGLASTTNPTAALLGTNLETDTELRVRRRKSVSIAGAGTVDAITANILQITGVTDAFIVENRTLVVDAGGRPGKSFEAIVTGGSDASIAQEIWNRKPAGIETFGGIAVVVQDSLSNNRTVNFSRPTDVWIHLEIDYTLYGEENFPANGETSIAASAVTAGNSLAINEDVILQRFLGPIFTDVSGIASIAVRIATSVTEFGVPGAFGTADLEILSTEIARFDVARVTVAQV